MRHLAVVIVLLSWLELCLSRPHGLPGWPSTSDTDYLSRAAVLTRLLSKLERAMQQHDAPAEDYQYALENSAHDRDSLNTGLTPEVMSKRKSFWQPMGGPLPVATRFTAFGSRIEPDRVQNGNEKGGIKAMRYGRRR